MSNTTNNPYQVPAHAKPIDVSKLTFMGSMNYPVQVFNSQDYPDKVMVYNYMPRKGVIAKQYVTKEEARVLIEEQMERMKIAICQFEEFLEGKVDSVYYWQLENEKR
jgi:hypothetical protein